MKTKTTFIAVLLAIGFLTAVASADQSYRITLSDTSRIGAAELKAGEYKMVVDAPSVVLTELATGKSIKLDAKIANLDQKVERTEVHSNRVDGIAQIKEIRLGGSKTKISFD